MLLHETLHGNWGIQRSSVRFSAFSLTLADTIPISDIHRQAMSYTRCQYPADNRLRLSVARLGMLIGMPNLLFIRFARTRAHRGRIAVPTPK